MHIHSNKPIKLYRYILYTLPCNKTATDEEVEITLNSKPFLLDPNIKYLHKYEKKIE